MVLKEAFRMQNYLTDLSQQALLFLAKKENVMKIKQEHLRSKSNPSAQDEVLEVKRETEMVPNCVVELYLDLLAEREKLTAAISKAKAAAEMDIDGAIAMNKAKQEAVFRLKNLAGLASSEQLETGKDYLINSEGNQTPYVYTIKAIHTIDFDRDMVKGVVKRLQRETDAVSAQVDLLNVTLEVAYEPKYEFDDSFEDAYEKYVKYTP